MRLLKQTDLREVFGFIQCAGNKDAARKFTEDYRENFEQIEEDAFDVITALTGSEELLQVKAQYQEEGGTINMCEAIRGMIEDGVQRGKLEGKQEGKKEGILEEKTNGIKALIEVCKEFGISRSETCSKIMDKYSLTLDEAENFMKSFWR